MQLVSIHVVMTSDERKSTFMIRRSTCQKCGKLYYDLWRPKIAGKTLKYHISCLKSLTRLLLGSLRGFLGKYWSVLILDFVLWWNHVSERRGNVVMMKLFLLLISYDEVIFSYNYYNSGRWALGGPPETLPLAVAARFPSERFAGDTCTLCRQSPLPDPDGSSTAGTFRCPL